MSSEDTRVYDEMINRNPMKLSPGHIEISSDGRLLFCGYDTAKLAEKHGTPLMIFDQKQLRKSYRSMREAFLRHYDKVQICFAYKSNHMISVLRVFNEEGAYADVVSAGEFFKAETAGVPASHIVMNGNNKLPSELKQAIEKGALINVDALDELYLAARIASEAGKPARVCIRVNPDISTNIIAEFSTALKKSKFGIDMDNGDAEKAFLFAEESPDCQLEGIHSHIGSQIEDSRFYRASTEKIMDFCGMLKQKHGIDLQVINMGGGFAIPFDYLDQVDEVESFAEIMSEILHQKIEAYGLVPPVIMVEPGGSLSGTSAVTLCSVGSIKEKEEKKLAALDAGGDLLLRATQGWYTYRAVCANKMNQKPMQCYDLVGPLCYEGDIPAHDRMLPELEAGDVIAFIDTGAYVTTLLNQYNGRLSPEILMVDDNGEIQTVRRRSTLKDLVRDEVY